MNKSIGSWSSAKNSLKPKKHVTLERTENIPTQFRTYGYIKTNQLSTPFPQKTKPVDLEAVTAKLEAETKMQLRSSKSSQSVLKERVKFSREYSSSVTERLIAFAMRRKLFDKGVPHLQGRKTTDQFHPTLPGDRRQGDRLVDRQIQSRDKRYFEEVTKFCIANNIKIAKGNL